MLTLEAQAIQARLRGEPNLCDLLCEFINDNKKQKLDDNKREKAKEVMFFDEDY